MPASIFSETELARLASFPEEIPGDDLIRAFTLTGADRDLVAIRRGAANRLGLALQLCALRYLGFVPRNLSAAPRFGRLLCRGPARGQPGRDSILRSTRANALHSTSPRFGNTSASRCSGHGTFSGSSVSSRNPESTSKHSPTRRRQSSNISVRPRSPSRRPCAWRRVGSCSRPLQWRSCPTRSFS